MGVGCVLVCITKCTLLKNYEKDAGAIHHFRSENCLRYLIAPQDHRPVNIYGLDKSFGSSLADVYSSIKVKRGYSIQGRCIIWPIPAKFQAGTGANPG